MGVQQAIGGTVAWHCEFDANPSKILAHRWPEVPNLGDITAADWSQVDPVDVITGGFPCQDVSHAGRRQGLIRDGEGRTRSGLWGHMLRAIDALRPALVVAENVRGLLSAQADSDVEPCPWCLGDDPGQPAMRALGAVLADLADIGYDAEWCGLRAADVGAPHGRLRVFVLAWPASDAGSEHGQQWRFIASGQAPTGRPFRDNDSCLTGALRMLPTPVVADSRNARQSTAPNPRADNDTLSDVVYKAAFGDYAPAIARWEQALGRPAPAPTEPTGRNGAHRLSPAFVEWMMGLPAGHVTEVPGLTRNAQLKALGNGVVPRQAAEAVRYLTSAVL